MTTAISPILPSSNNVLQSSTVVQRLVSGAVEFAADELDYGTQVGEGGSTTAQPYGWRLSDGSLLEHKYERDLGDRGPGSAGYVTVRGPESVGVAIAGITQPGLGHVTAVRQAQEIGLLYGTSRTIAVPALEFSGFGARVNWANPTPRVDVLLGVTPGAPRYRIYGAGFYGPTGYWITQSQTKTRNVAVPLSFYATDYECAFFSYSISVGAEVVDTGTMNSGTVLNSSYTTVLAGTYPVTATLTDANGKIVVLSGPVLTVINDLLPLGNFLLPVAGTYRVNSKLLVKIWFLDPDGIANWIVRCNGVALTAGSTSNGIYVTFDWTPAEANTYMFTADLIDDLGQGTTITGPTIIVVALDAAVS